MPINHLGGQVFRAPPPVTRPPINLPPLDLKLSRPRRRRRWKASTAHGNGGCPADLKRDAVAAWARFRSCLEAMPSDQARLLWQAVLSEARSMTMPTPLRRGGG
jgi:hypothetical protein